MIGALGYAQQIPVGKIGLEKGLSDNYILCIAQDEDGYMWFGTEWGLNKYDGRTITSYKVGAPTQNTISHNGINKLLVDTVQNLIWIGTKGAGLNTYNYRTQQFYHFPLHTDAPNATKANGITDICFDKDGDLWLSTYRAGLRKLNRKTHHIEPIELNNPALPKVYRIWCIEDDLQGHLFIGHWQSGLSIYSILDKTTKNFQHIPGDSESLPGNIVDDICFDTKGNIWIGTYGGLAIYHPETEKFTVFKYDPENPDGISNDDIRSVTQIGDEIWIGTWKGGINIIDLNTEDLSVPEKVKFRHIASSELPTGLSSPAIESIFSDSFGNIWMGSYGEGLNVISHIRPYFKTLSYAKLKGDIHGLSDKAVNCFTFGKDSLLYVGLNNGYVDIYKLNYKNEPFYKIKTIFPGNNILSMLSDSNGNIWFGRDIDGLMVYDTHKHTLSKPDFITENQCSGYMACMYEDSEQNLWFGTNCGIVKYNPYTKEVKEIAGNEIGLRDNFVRQIAGDVNGNLWIGSKINGVSVITPDFEVIEHFSVDDALGAQNINHIYRDSQDKMWVATKKGVTCFPSVKASNYGSHLMDISNGLKDNFVRSVTEGKDGEIWFTTNVGITKYTEQIQKFEHFDNNDGIPLGTFNSYATSKTSDGKILLGTQNGICYFNSNEVFILQEVPQTVLTNFEVYDSKANATLNCNSLANRKNIELKYSQNTISVQFNVMDYALNTIAEYAYQLSGINDNQWHTIKEGNKVTFRNLSPGQYSLSIRARIHNQQWSEHSSSVHFKIQPPYWLSWWAYAIYILITGIIVFAITFFYRRKLILENQLYLEKENHEREQKIHTERQQFFTNLTHELKTPLTLILSPIEELLKSEQNHHKLKLIHRSALRLNGLINQLMEFRKTETHNKQLTVRTENISLLLQTLVYKYKELNTNKKLSIEFYSETTSSLLLDREVFTSIMDNLISNAIKNTSEGQVIVIVKEIVTNEKSDIEIEVSDTGIGIPSDALSKIFDRYYQVKREQQISGTGIGLALVKSLVQLHKASIDVSSELSKGTSFYLRLNAMESYPEAIHFESQKTMDSKPHFEQLLIVEDNDDIRDYIADLFSKSMHVSTAKDGQEGLELAINNSPDLIVSDIMMPVMDGIEMCKKLKSNIITSHIPVILLTAKDSEADKTEGYSMGADSYLAKPFGANLLKARVDNLLQSRKKIATYFATAGYKKEMVSHSLSQLDDEFITKTIAVIEKNIDMEQMSVSFLAEKADMSYSSFSKKIKAITNLTVTEFIKDIKMQEAETLLLSGKHTVSEIASLVGYNSLAYFRKAFKDKFGTSPTQYLQQLANNRKK